MAIASVAFGLCAQPALSANGYECVPNRATAEDVAAFEAYVAGRGPQMSNSGPSDEEVQERIEMVATECALVLGWGMKAATLAQIQAFAELNEEALRNGRAIPTELLARIDTVAAGQGQDLNAAFDRIARSQLGLGSMDASPSEQQAFEWFGRAIDPSGKSPHGRAIFELMLAAAMQRVTAAEFAKN